MHENNNQNKCWFGFWCTRDKRAGLGENDSKDWGQPVLLLLLWYNLIRGKSYVISRDRAIRLEQIYCFWGSNNFDSEIMKTYIECPDLEYGVDWTLYNHERYRILLHILAKVTFTWTELLPRWLSIRIYRLVSIVNSWMCEFINQNIKSSTNNFRFSGFSHIDRNPKLSSCY